MKKHQAAVRPEELPDLLRKIDAYDETTGDTLTRLALQLLGATWEEFDLEAAIWVIPAGRMKMKTEHIVPFPRHPGSTAAYLRRWSVPVPWPEQG